MSPFFSLEGLRNGLGKHRRLSRRPLVETLSRLCMLMALLFAMFALAAIDSVFAAAVSPWDQASVHR